MNKFLLMISLTGAMALNALEEKDFVWFESRQLCRAGKILFAQVVAQAIQENETTSSILLTQLPSAGETTPLNPDQFLEVALFVFGNVVTHRPTSNQDILHWLAVNP